MSVPVEHGPVCSRYASIVSDVRHAAVAGLFYPGKAELHELSEWIARELRVDVPLHFTAFHPDYRLTDRPATPPATLVRARRIAREHGLHDVYTGNVHDLDGDTT